MRSPTTRFVTTEKTMNTRGDSFKHHGARIRYWRTGPETGPLVVCVHGAALDHRMFGPQLEPLVKAGYRVLTWDLRGHGRSKPMRNTFSLEAATDDLLALLDTLGEDKVTLVGHSFGGYIAQEFTYKYPERVNALVVIGSTSRTDKPSRFMAVMAKIVPLMLGLMSVEGFRKQTVVHISTKEEVTLYAYDATELLNRDEYIAVILAGLKCFTSPAYDSSYTIPVPFLLTHGALDKANRGVYPRRAPAWAAREPKCRYEVIPGAGHLANQDNPEHFNAILLEFLREHAPAGSSS